MNEARIRDLVTGSLLANSALEIDTGDLPGSSRAIPTGLVAAGARSYVLSRSVAVAPTSPEEGDRYLVAIGATGLWAGRAGQIAQWLLLPNTTGESLGSWYFLAALGINFVEDEQLAISVSANGTQTPIGGVATSLPLVSKSVDYAVQLTDGVIEVDASGGNRLITVSPLLGSLSSMRLFRILKVDASANLVEIGNGAQIVDAIFSPASAQGKINGYREVYANGTNLRSMGAG